MMQLGKNFDFAQEALSAERRGELGLKHLDRDGALVLEIAGEVYRRHRPASELTLDGVTAGESGSQVVEGRGTHEALVSPPMLGHSRLQCQSEVPARDVSPNVELPAPTYVRHTPERGLNRESRLPFRVFTTEVTVSLLWHA